MGTVHIAIAFDQYYSRFFYSLAASLADHHAPGTLAYHAIITGVTDTELARIRQVVENDSHAISFYTVDETLASRFVLNDGRRVAAYYRLFFPFVIPPSVQRILYLDLDTIVHNSLYDFYALDLEGHPLAAVYDIYVRTQPLLGIDREGEYFNSGVMLIDLPRWRELKITEQTADYLLTYPERIRYVDQCGLNAVLIGRWKKLSREYNLMYSWIPPGLCRRALKAFVKDALVIHYTLERPWTMLCRNRLRNLYFYYQRKAGNARSGNRYTDFSYSRIPAWIMIRLRELYLDLPFLHATWRKLKSLVQ